MFIFSFLIKKYPHGSQRFLEILPGFISWSMILFPLWGTFIFPLAVAYYILAFNVYWLYRSLTSAVLAVLSHFRIQAGEIYDWMGDVYDFTDWNKVFHVVVIPTYKEPGETLKRTLNGLLSQTFTAKNIIPVIAFESRAGEKINAPREKLLK